MACGFLAPSLGFPNRRVGIALAAGPGQEHQCSVHVLREAKGLA